MCNTQVFLAQGDDDLPLVVDELDGVTVTVLAMVLGVQVCQLILALDVVDAVFALHQFLHEKIIPQRDMLCARNVGTVAGDVRRRRVIDKQRHAAGAFVEAQLQHHVGEEYRLLLYCQSHCHDLCLHRGLCGQPL